MYMNKIFIKAYRFLRVTKKLHISENQKLFINIKNNKNWNSHDINDQLNNLNFHGELVAKTSEIRKIIMDNVNLLNDNSLHKLLQLYANRLSSIKDLEYFLDLAKSKHLYYFDDKIIKRLFEKCKPFMKDLDEHHLSQLILIYSKNEPELPKKEIEEAVVSKLQYLDKSELIRFLIDTQFITNGLLVDLLLQPNIMAVIESFNKELLYNLMIMNNIFLPESLQLYFKEFIDKEYIKESDKQYFEAIDSLSSLNLSHALKLYNRYPHDSSTVLKTKLKPHIVKLLEKNKSELKTIVDVLDLILEASEKDFNEIFIKEFTDELNNIMQNYFEFTNKTEFLTSALYIFTNILKKLEMVKLQRKFITEENAYLVKDLSLIFEHFIIDALLDEKIDSTLFTMEEIAFYNAKSTKIEYKVNSYNHTSTSIKPWLQFYKDLLKSGFANTAMLNNLNNAFCNVAKIMELVDLIDFIEVLNYANQKEVEHIPLLNEAISTYTESIKETNLEFRLKFLVEYTKFLILTKNMQLRNWQIIKNINISKTDLELLNNEQRVDLYLCKKILENSKRPYLSYISIELPHNYYISKGEELTSTFKYYFEYLFYENIETDVKCDIINLNYVQDKKVLLLFDYDDTVGLTNTLTGSCELIIKYLSCFFNSITYLTHYELSICKKRNDKMHLLRVNTKGWSVDIDKRTEFYNKPYEEII